MSKGWNFFKQQWLPCSPAMSVYHSQYEYCACLAPVHICACCQSLCFEFICVSMTLCLKHAAFLVCPTSLLTMFSPLFMHRFLSIFTSPFSIFYIQVSFQSFICKQTTFFFAPYQMRHTGAIKLNSFQQSDALSQDQKHFMPWFHVRQCILPLLMTELKCAVLEI